MTTRSAPADPLVVILGSTGTGKSELAIELASRFRGEIINADAMQMYKGLPILTNKITPDERRGIPHHLLDHISLGEPTWTVDDFKREANKVIGKVRSKGNLPIVVGGTHYYTNALLFEDSLVGPDEEKEARDGGAKDEQDDASSFPIFNEPTEVILAKLREVDPVMADRWHPNDRRKISRSLQIYLQHGRPASEIYAEQRQRRSAVESNTTGDDGGGAGPWQTLLFWVYSDPETLKARLDKRVDKMLTVGLDDETQCMYDYVRDKEAAGEEIDYTRGIWQSIGFKEFEPYLKALNSADDADKDADHLAALKAAGLEDMKTSTRQYAKYQTRWIRKKIVPPLQDLPGALDHLFVVDSTDVSRWAHDVVEPAVDIARRFLEGAGLPDPTALSETAGEVLREARGGQTQQTPCRRTCEVCRTTCVTEQDWRKHVKSKRHGALLRLAKRRALVVGNSPMAVVSVETATGGSVAEEQEEVEAEDDRCSSPELEGLGLFDTSR